MKKRIIIPVLEFLCHAPNVLEKRDLEITEKALNDGAMIIVNPCHLSKEDVAELPLRAE